MNLAQRILQLAATKPEKAGQLLSELHERGETGEDILLFVEELRKQMISVQVPTDWQVFDVCGTGGSQRQRINISTALAIKLAKEGFLMAKNGNRAASGRVGSFDLIAEARLPVSDTPDKILQNLTNHSLALIFAPAFHPCLKPLTPIRQSLGHPSIFNFLGPLLNPVALTAQMIGVSNRQILLPLAEACAAMQKNALLVHDTVFGLDDVSIGGETIFYKIIDGRIETGTWVPEDFGQERVHDFSKLSGGNVKENLRIFQELLADKGEKEKQSFWQLNQKVARDFFQQFIV